MAKIDIKDVPAKLIDQHMERAQDVLSEHDLKWKIVGMNGRSFPTADEGTVPNRVLLVLQEEIIKEARIG